MTRSIHNPFFATIATVVAVFAASNALANDELSDGFRPLKESVEIADHVVFGSPVVVNGATILTRNFNKREIEASISTRALEADSAYSIWWAVFNYPEYCIEPYACTLADLGMDRDPRVRQSVFWGGGFVSDAYGGANTTIRLSPGRVDREPFANTENYGLQNLAGAEIHVVLRTHGPVGMAGPVSQQIGTASEACPPDDCSNVFVSIHKAPRQK